MIAVDLELLADGRSSAPDGTGWRRLWYLERIGRDVLTADVTIYWHNLDGRTARCDLARRLIYLDPWLYKAMPYYVRKSISHELLHIISGRRCEEWIWLTQARRYGEIIQPPPWLVA